jgi:hypothetical protein
MNTLIDNLITIFKNAIDAGTVSAKTAYKGIHDDPDFIPIDAYPYIAIDDGGEKVEDSGTENTRWRKFSVNIEFATYSTDMENALSSMLQLSDEIKTTFELEANRQKHGQAWGVSIQPLAGIKDNYFIRGRLVTVEYMDLEDGYFDY